MTKDIFLSELNRRLSNRPDKTDIVNFYYEQITDRLENGETEDEIFADINIEDILLSLNETDSFEKEKTDLNIPEPIIYKNDNKDSSTATEEKKEEINKPYTGNNYEGLSGGRKFWYIVWTIATVVFCIAAVCVQIACVCICIGAVSLFVSGGVAFSQSIGVGLVLSGIGFIVLGSGVVGNYFANVLRRYVFTHRTIWNDAIYTKLGGAK